MRLIQHYSFSIHLFPFYFFPPPPQFLFLAHISSLSLTYEFLSTSLGGILIE